MERRTSAKAADVWEDERPDWSKGGLAVKPSLTAAKIEEKNKYGYPTPQWPPHVRSKNKVSQATVFHK